MIVFHRDFDFQFELRLHEISLSKLKRLMSNFIALSIAASLIEFWFDEPTAPSIFASKDDYTHQQNW